MKNIDLVKIADTMYEMLPDTYTAAVILAAGNSTRMGKVNKQLLKLNGIPVLAHTLMAYQKCPLIREIVVFARGDQFEEIFEMSKKYGIAKLKKLVVGGNTRQESAKKGVAKLSANVKYVAIADGARCLTTPATITKVCLAAYRHMSACAGHYVSDTVKRASLLGNVQQTVDRTGLWLAQTPQVFHTSLYHAALVKAEEDHFSVTDDTSLIEHLGYQVRMVECGLANIKITTPADLPMAQAVLDYRSKK
jgi:2-C-methyl-D-erythritol 4-phosphate cytidylyltransferase